MQKKALSRVLACTLAILMLATTLTIGTASAAKYPSFSGFFDKFFSTADESTTDELPATVDESTSDESTDDEKWFEKFPSIQDILDFFEKFQSTSDESWIDKIIDTIRDKYPTNQDNKNSDFSYRIEKLSITITGYNGTADEVEIPAYIKGLPVRKIDVYAFSDNTTITSVTVPKTVKTIGVAAFSNCENLENINLSEGLEVIEDLAFSFCPKLTSLTLPETVTTIGESIISECGITEINIPASVESVSENAFDYCSSLEDVFVDDANGYYYSVDGAFCQYSTDDEGDALIFYPYASPNEEFTVPESVTKMRELVFNECANLKTLYMSATNSTNKLTTFISDCSNLETIYFDGTIEEWNEFEWPIFFCLDQNITVICNDGTIIVNEEYYSGEDASDDEATGDETTGDEATGDEGTGDEATKDEFELGDVNCDGKLNIRDATLIQKHLAKLETLTEAQLLLADFNADEKVNVRDATAIQKKLAHIE